MSSHTYCQMAPDLTTELLRVTVEYDETVEAQAEDVIVAVMEQVERLRQSGVFGEFEAEGRAA